MAVILPKANAKATGLPLLLIAVAVVQLGSAFLAIAVQQSNGPQLARFLDGLVMVTTLWAAIALVDMFAFPDTSTTPIVVTKALIVALAATAFHIIFRGAEAIMGHSLGLRYAIGQIGFTGTLIWGWASLWFLGSQKYRERVDTAKTAVATKPDVEEVTVDTTIIDMTTADAPSNGAGRSAFSAWLDDDDVDKA